MSKRWSLCGNWAGPNVALFLSLLSFAGLFTFPAGAESDPAVETSSKPESPAEGVAPPSSSEAKPAPAAEERKEAKPKEALAKSEAGEPPATIRASNVNAVYRISWLGANIGDFRLRSSITNRQYSLQANADVSVFFGAFTWQGVTSSHGLMTANGPMPQNYAFRYAASNNKHEAIELRFTQRIVRDILINPPQRVSSRAVPITAAHLQNVVDPLSALVLLSQARLMRNGSDACTRRLPIFDGKTRYDLVLAPKGTRSIGNSGKLRGMAYVCSVRYVPIAGYKPGRSENDYATGNTGIEVWLVPVPEAGLVVPYYIHVPTPAGVASMVTAKFDIDTPAGRHALAN